MEGFSWKMAGDEKTDRRDGVSRDFFLNCFFLDYRVSFT